MTEEREAGTEAGAAPGRLTEGTIFDIKEFSTNDGPGVRQTVFLKGCPLHCAWCHNPEGLTDQPQLMVQRGACTDCGACKESCPQKTCSACGACTEACPLRLRRICGERVTAGELAERLWQNASIYEQMDGGVTFSGGEPLAQPAFLNAVCGLLPGIHKVLETSGFASAGIFDECIRQFDLVLIDIKHMDPDKHFQLTGADNAQILANIRTLDGSGTPYIVRIPVIPGCNDARDNFKEAAAFLGSLRHLKQIELLPANAMAGSKYVSLGLEEPENIRPPAAQTLSEAAAWLEGLPVRILK